MRRLIILFLLAIAKPIYAQNASGIWQPYIYTNPISEIQFVNNNVGFAVSNGYESEKLTFSLLKTINGGTEWQPLGGSFDKINSYSAINENNIWLSQNGYLSDGAVFKTSDGGNSWQTYYKNLEAETSPSGTVSVSLLNAKIKFFNSNLGFISTPTSLCKTTNAGTTWTQLTTNQGNIFYVDNDVMFSYGSSLSPLVIKKSVDGGSNWQNITNPLTTANFSLYFINENTGYIYNGQKLFKTSNGGTSWQEITITTSGALSSLKFVSEQEGYATLNGYLLKTSNSGATWDYVGNTTAKISNVYLTNNNLYTSGSNGNISKLQNNDLVRLTGMDNDFLTVTEDKGNVRENNGVYEFLQTAKKRTDAEAKYSKTSLNNTTHKIITEQTNIPISVPAGIMMFPNQIHSVAYNPSKTVEITYPRPFRTYNGDLQNYTQMFDLTGSTSPNLYFLDIQFYNDNSAYGVSANRIYKTDNQGTSWTILLDQNNDSYPFSDIQTLSQNSCLIVGRKNILYKTTDGGQTWNTIAITNDTNQHFTNLFFVNDLIGWAFGEKGAIFKTIDAGNTWIDKSININNTINDLVFVNEDEGWITSGGTYHTINGGTTWVQDLSVTYSPSTIKFKNNLEGLGWKQRNAYLFEYLKTPLCPQINNVSINQNNGVYQMSVNWTPSANSTSYNVYYFLSGSNNIVNLGKTINNSYTFENIPLTQITPGQNIVVRVRPVNLQYENACANDYIYNTSTLGTENISLKDNISTKIAPNPVSDILNIVSSEKIIRSEIYSQDGRLILTSNNDKVNMRSLLKGYYFIKVYLSNKTVENLKFIKN